MDNRPTIIGRLRNLSLDNAPHSLECVLRLGRTFIQTKAGRMLAGWWGIKLGRNVMFYGIPLFRRLPGSIIRIADDCQFRSSGWSNLVGINRPCTLSTLRRTAVIEIGEGCGFSGTVIGAAVEISLGARVMCGANVTITDTDWHAIDWRDRAAGAEGKSLPVVIGNDVWLGMNVTVLKGVTIGDRTVVGAGSIVSRSLPAGVIASGQPAVVVRTLRSGEHAPCRTA